MVVSVLLLLDSIYIAHLSSHADCSRRCSVMVCLTQARPVTFFLQAQWHCVAIT